MNPITLQVGVKVLLKNPEGKILLLRRSEEKYGKIEGSWDIAGGRIEPSTELMANLEREVQEETQLCMDSTPKLIAAQDILKNDRHIVRLTYTARTEGEPILDLTEHVEYSWVTFDELVALKNLDSYVRELIDLQKLQADSWD
jgi:8-oxo-dGTP pyrophosphatase MutT (NUDIX family)